MIVATDDLCNTLFFHEDKYPELCDYVWDNFKGRTASIELVGFQIDCDLLDESIFMDGEVSGAIAQHRLDRMHKIAKQYLKTFPKSKLEEYYPEDRIIYTGEAGA